MIRRPDKDQLEKFLNNTCTPEEAEAILTWWATPEGGKFAAEQLDLDMNKPEVEVILPEVHPIRSAYMFQQIQDTINNYENSGAKIQIGLLYQKWLKIAVAILIPLLTINVAFWYYKLKPVNTEISWHEVYVPRGEKRQVLFQDGTIVWLNSDTKLKYPVGFQGEIRKVELEGEAYFIVHKNLAKPFLVHSRDIDIKVTGTSFDVKAYKDENKVTTALDEGKVSLFLQQNENQVEYILKPGQQASFARNTGKISIVSCIPGQNSNWKENKLIFKDTPFPEVIRVLERWYNVKFISSNAKFPGYSYTITFNNESIQNVLLGLERITPVGFKLKDGKVFILRK